MNEEQIINRIVESLQAIHPAWRTSLKTQKDMDEFKKQWLIGLKENHVSDIEQIKQGLKQARRSPSPFMPSIGQFIEWCKIGYSAPCHQDFKAIEFDSEPASREAIDKMLIESGLASMIKRV